MNNKKQIIQVTVIILAFAGAALVLYKGGLFGSTASQPAAALVSPVTPAQDQQEILPYGTTLDFSSVILPSRFQYNTIQYPQLNVQSDVGVPVNTMLAPLPTPGGAHP